MGELGDVRAEDLQSLIIVEKGRPFPTLITATEERLTGALGNGGFTFATASGVPKLNDDDTVDIEFSLMRASAPTFTICLQVTR